MGGTAQLLTAPGALGEVRWRWLLRQPAGTVDAAWVAQWAAPGPPTPALTSRLVAGLVEWGQLGVEASVPVPPDTGKGGESRGLWGLAMLGPAGQLLGAIAFDPPIPAGTPPVRVSVRVLTGG